MHLVGCFIRNFAGVPIDQTALTFYHPSIMDLYEHNLPPVSGIQFST